MVMNTGASGAEDFYDKYFRFTENPFVFYCFYCGKKYCLLILSLVGDTPTGIEIAGNPLRNS
jgi:hypothetical protein